MGLTGISTGSPGLPLKNTSRTLCDKRTHFPWLEEAAQPQAFPQNLPRGLFACERSPWAGLRELHVISFWSRETLVQLYSQYAPWVEVAQCSPLSLAAAAGAASPPDSPCEVSSWEPDASPAVTPAAAVTPEASRPCSCLHLTENAERPLPSPWRPSGVNPAGQGRDSWHHSSPSRNHFINILGISISPLTWTSKIQVQIQVLRNLKSMQFWGQMCPL